LLAPAGHFFFAIRL